MKSNLASRVERLKAQLDALTRKELIGGWLNADETEATALERLVAAGRIHVDEQRQVQLSRWFTAEEAEKPASCDC